jgi:hypothetical protein
MRLLRLVRILYTGARYGLDEFLLGHERTKLLRWLVNVLFFWRPLRGTRALRLRLALESLGPIFVKFGQVLSTRRDLIAAGYCRRTGRVAGPRAAVPFRTGAGGTETRLRPRCPRRFALSSIRRRSPRPQWPRCIAPP